MKLAQILDEKGRGAITTSVNDTLATVFTTLADRKVGALVVCDHDKKIVGIISERDLVRAVAKDGERVLAWPVESVMTSKVVTCDEEDTVHDLMEKMTAGRFRHMPVVKDGKLNGVISIGDIVKNRIEEVEREAENMRAYIHAV